MIEAGVNLPEFEVRTIDLGGREQFSREYTAINPNQKIPALVDGDRNIMESCAVLLYLAEKFPSPLMPEGELRWQVIPWLFWQAANLGPVFGNKLSYTRYMDDIDPVQKAHPLERFGSEAQRLSRVLNEQLEGRDYICGDTFTVADIACYPWLRGWKWSKVDITRYANVVAWVKRVRARPGVDQWRAPTSHTHALSGHSPKLLPVGQAQHSEEGIVGIVALQGKTVLVDCW